MTESAHTPTLLSLLQRWAALDAGAWHVQRHAAEKAELIAETQAAIAAATDLAQKTANETDQIR